jgi:hypothetical protein
VIRGHDYTLLIRVVRVIRGQPFGPCPRRLMPETLTVSRAEADAIARLVIGARAMLAW